MKIKDIYNEFVERRNEELNEQRVYDLIWQLDVGIYDDIMSQSVDCPTERPSEYKYGIDDLKEGLIPAKYKNMYINWLSAHTNYEYKDDEGYSNDMILYNNEREEFASEYLHRHKPVKSWELMV